MKTRASAFVSLLALMCTLELAWGQEAATAPSLKLAAPFGNHMVLQRDLPVKIWGTAPSGTQIAIEISQSATKVHADAAGKWSATLPGLSAGGPHVLKVNGGDESIELSDVLIGEVWLCSGQSNMAWTMLDFKERSDPTFGNDIDAANDPMIRLGHVGHRVAFTPATDTPIRWNICTPASAGKFSATAYLFARSLQKRLGVPVGVMNASWGGTPAEAWTDRATLDSDPAFQPAIHRLETYKEQYPKYLAAWELRVEKLKNDPTNPPMPLKPRVYEKNANLGTTMWNAKIHPLVPMTFRGVVWYQGEADAARQQPAFYAKLLPSMFTAWRAAFERGDDLRLLIVQLPMFGKDRAGLKGSYWAQLRDAQAQTARSLKNAFLCVALDLGKADNLHPPGKRQLGARLAALASQSIPPEEPAPAARLARAQFGEGRTTLYFENPGKGLKLSNIPDSTDFIVAGEDRVWHIAQPVCDGDTVILRSAQVQKPVAARYAWSDSPHAVLTDSSGLPLAPFRTDTWPLLKDRDSSRRPASDATTETP